MDDGGLEDEGDSSDSDDAKLPSLQGARGTAAALRLKEAMRKHPAKFTKDMTRRAAESLEDPGLVESGDLASRYLAEEVPVQNQKAMGYLLSGIAHISRAPHEKPFEDAELLSWRLLAAGDQCCLDGTCRTAWGVTGLAEPSWGRWSQLDVCLLRKTHGASRLLSESWVAVETQRLRDVQFLVEQRPKGGPPGKNGAPQTG